MGRPFSPPQIHQKNISTPSKFHKTTSECRQRTSGIQKSSSLSSKRGRKTKKETKAVGTELHPGKGVLKREKFPNTRKHSHCRVCGEAWNHRKQHQLSSVQFSSSVVSDSLRPHESQHTRPPCPTPGVHPNSCPSSR